MVCAWREDPFALAVDESADEPARDAERGRGAVGGEAEDEVRGVHALYGAGARVDVNVAPGRTERFPVKAKVIEVVSEIGKPADGVRLLALEGP